MRSRFVVGLAWREGRSSLKRIALYLSSIALGVGALVALHSFRADVVRGIRSEARTLLGADAMMARNRPFSDSTAHLVDSLTQSGTRTSRITSLLSMVYASRSENTRLLWLWAVSGGFPYYGEVTTDPPGLWRGLQESGSVLVDPAILTQLDTRLGDTLRIGLSAFVVRGVVKDLPSDIGPETHFMPRVYLPADSLRGTGLLRFGSLAEYRQYFRIPDEAGAEVVNERYEQLFRSTQTRFVTAEEQADMMTEGVEILSGFLSIVGLAALLLGGIGVGSAIHVYLRGKLTTIAVLRCIGATRGQVFLAYLVQAAGLGALGAGSGVVLGIGVQYLLPVLMGDLMPMTVRSTPSLVPIATGFGVGIWVTLLFALFPLLRVRDVPPLLALRIDFEPAAGSRRWIQALVLVLLAGSATVFTLVESPAPAVGIAFAAALLFVSAILWATALLLVKGTRRFFPRRAAYPIRQGVANLFRPRNQTVAVTLSLGFAVFVVSTLLLCERNLRADLSLGAVTSDANLLVFDVQDDQVEGVVRLLEDFADTPPESTPMVPARIAAVNGVASEALLADSSGAGPARWALRREYRHTHRADLMEWEELLSGEWWEAEAAPGITDVPHDDPRAVRISVEADLAGDLGVDLGDRITWSIEGRELLSQVTSIRRVDWNRFEPNFFVVFEPGALAGFTMTHLTFARIESDSARAAFQRQLVDEYPNVSALDFTRLLEIAEQILTRVNQAIVFLSTLGAIAGMLVLTGTLATSRYQRVRESALLKTLGARREQLVKVFVAEYLALGSLGAASGLLMSWAASWLLATYLFRVEAHLHPLWLSLIWLAVVAVTLVTGLAHSRGILRRRPLAILRDVAG